MLQVDFAGVGSAAELRNLRFLQVSAVDDEGLVLPPSETLLILLVLGLTPKSTVVLFYLLIGEGVVENSFRTVVLSGSLEGGGLIGLGVKFEGRRVNLLPLLRLYLGVRDGRNGCFFADG